jgi:hypothetical protein
LFFEAEEENEEEEEEEAAPDDRDDCTFRLDEEEVDEALGWLL